MTQEQKKVFRAKVGLLELAKQLGSVSQACKVMGYSRDNANYILIISVIGIIAKNNPREFNELVELMQLERFREIAIVTIPSAARGSRRAREGPARWRRMHQPAPPNSTTGAIGGDRLRSSSIAAVLPICRTQQCLED